MGTIGDDDRGDDERGDNHRDDNEAPKPVRRRTPINIAWNDVDNK
jgi:hypothetical protein